MINNQFIFDFPPLRWFPSDCSRRYTQVLEARHFGRDAEIQRPRMATWVHDKCPCIQEHETTGWQAILIKRMCNRLDTVHGLDFGIPAEMTGLP